MGCVKGVLTSGVFGEACGGEALRHFLIRLERSKTLTTSSSMLS